MELANYRVLTPTQAADFREMTLGAEHQLNPILVRGGVHLNKFVLPDRVTRDPNHEDKWGMLLMLPYVTLDNEVIFPPEPET
jgi:hypothetical protein